MAGEIDPKYQGKLGCCSMMEAGNNRLEPKGFLWAPFSVSTSSSKSVRKTRTTNTKVGPRRNRPFKNEGLGHATKERTQPPVVLAEGKGTGKG